MATWIDVTAPENWVAQRIVFASYSGCTPVNGYTLDTSSIYTWDGTKWVAPTLTTVNYIGLYSTPNIPVLSYIGPIAPLSVNGVRVTARFVGAHTFSFVGGWTDYGLWVSIDPAPDTPSYAPNFVVDVFPLASGAYTSGTDIVVTLLSDPTSDVIHPFEKIIASIFAAVLSNDVDSCGPFFFEDNTPAPVGLDIIKVELSTGLRGFWTDFVSAEEHR